MLVSGRRVNIPSYLVRPGDVVEIAERREQLRIKGAVEEAANAVSQSGSKLMLALKGVYKAVPQRAELSASVKEQLIVELYATIRQFDGKRSDNTHAG